MNVRESYSRALEQGTLSCSHVAVNLCSAFFFFSMKGQYRGPRPASHDLPWKSLQMHPQNVNKEIDLHISQLPLCHQKHPIIHVTIHNPKTNVSMISGLFCTKQQPSTAGPDNMLGCCLFSFHFLWAILWPTPVQLIQPIIPYPVSNFLQPLGMY